MSEETENKTGTLQVIPEEYTEEIMKLYESGDMEGVSRIMSKINETSTPVIVSEVKEGVIGDE